jgi:cob(I)alamin adenosyltransferase
VALVVHLTKIYTRTGDDGTTSLGDFSRVRKTDPRLEAYADVDEANSAIGVAIAVGDLAPPLVEVLQAVQNDLFDVGADLCTPVVEHPEHPPLRVGEEYVTWLEEQCDRFNADLPALRSFILPGGTRGAAMLHVARTMVRRAERATWAALFAHGEDMNATPATYLNRLSDLLFILARVANTPQGRAPGTRADIEPGDVLWQPGRRQLGDAAGQ